MSSTEKPHPLAGTRVLVPQSRIGDDVLGALLGGRGAEVVAFPTLVAATPTDSEALARAAAAATRVDWILFSGGDSVRAVLDAVAGAAVTAAAGAIGHSAVRELARRGLRASYVPRRHTADEVSAGLPLGRGRRVLLAREEHATPELPERLRARGFEVTEVAAYRAEPRADGAAAARALVRLDLVAFANPTAVRFFAAALVSLGARVERCLAGVPIAAVGRATADAATAAGMEPDLVAAGRLKDLVHTIEQLYAPAARAPWSR